MSFPCSIEKTEAIFRQVRTMTKILEVPTELKRPLLDITNPSENVIESMALKKRIILEVHFLFKCGHCGTRMI